MMRLVEFLVVISFISSTKRIIECETKEDWGLRRRGWTWFNWYYFWYWRHGNWGKISDRDTICQRLWGLDHNRLHQGIHYDIFPQSRIATNSTQDKAIRTLFRFFNANKIVKRLTYKAFIDLLEDFQPGESGQMATVINSKKVVMKKVKRFLSAVTKTRIFEQLYWYLVRNLHIYPDKRRFEENIFDLWFNKGNFTSNSRSAFEKVFVGETVSNPSKLSVHNWIQFQRMEKRGLNYFGSIEYHKYDPIVMSLMFSWNKGAPITDNLFIGTSPEFELCLYTLCFFTNPRTDCECKINTKNIVVTTTTSDDGSKILNSRFELKV